MHSLRMHSLRYFHINSFHLGRLTDHSKKKSVEFGQHLGLQPPNSTDSAATAEAPKKAAAKPSTHVQIILHKYPSVNQSSNQTGDGQELEPSKNEPNQKPGFAKNRTEPKPMSWFLLGSFTE